MRDAAKLRHGSFQTQSYDCLAGIPLRTHENAHYDVNLDIIMVVIRSTLALHSTEASASLPRDTVWGQEVP